MVLRRCRAPWRAARSTVTPWPPRGTWCGAAARHDRRAAKGLDVPVSAARAAAAESTGMHYYDEPAGGSGRLPRAIRSGSC